MKIIYACDKFDHIEYAQVKSLINHNGVSDICVVTCTDKFADELRPFCRVEILTDLNKKRFYKKAQINFEKVVEDFKPEVVYTVHGNSMITNIICVIKKNKFKHIVKVTYRGVIGNLSPIVNPETWFTHSNFRVDACLGTSEAVAAYLREKNFIKNKVIGVLPPGISQQYLRQKTLEVSVIANVKPRAKLRIGFLGSMTRKIKGFDILAKSILGLKPELRDQIEVFCIGDSPFNRAKLESRCASFKFLGFDGNPWRHFKYLDYLVMPSRLEGFGRAGLEAFNLNLPIVTSGVGGISEYVKHGVNGLIVEENTPSAYSKIWEHMLKSPDFICDRERQSKAAFESSKNYTPEKSAETLYKNFMQAIKVRRLKLNK